MSTNGQTVLEERDIQAHVVIISSIIVTICLLGGSYLVKGGFPPPIEAIRVSPEWIADLPFSIRRWFDILFIPLYVTALYLSVRDGWGKLLPFVFVAGVLAGYPVITSGLLSACPMVFIGGFMIEIATIRKPKNQASHVALIGAFVYGAGLVPGVTYGFVIGILAMIGSIFVSALGGLVAIITYRLLQECGVTGLPTQKEGKK